MAPTRGRNSSFFLDIGPRLLHYAMLVAAGGLIVDCGDCSAINVLLLPIIPGRLLVYRWLFAIACVLFVTFLFFSSRSLCRKSLSK